ncbi:MAG: glucokinase [Bacillati bacterium ANGP1]|uniref:Glucokinase n=1 Tax=Candidatus Segetimicrobium genomatis TaxID=2569760 RepID=A0A537LBI0_9BACT|nr:MAG: glucokinase [Terrabacteria group bacterium ANGP1]
MSRVLVGDLGGTNTRLAIVSTDDGPRRWVAREDFRSRDHASLEELVRAFLSRTELQVSKATFGIAGPVVAGRASITNLPWVIDTVRLGTACGLPLVTLVNDVQALAHALLVLGADDLHTLNPGEPVRGGAMAVIAPGTGLGEAFVIWDGRRYQACASEGGHADFAPRDSLQIELLAYLRSRFDHVSYERVCAGPGIPNIYGYLKEHGAASEPRWLAEQLQAAGDPTPVIVTAALQEAAPALCRMALEMFVSILGAEAGNLALKVLATGGIYLGGGIPRRILPVLAGERFVAAFQRKGRLAQLLEHVPVHVILNPDAGLIGAAVYGLDERS